MPYNTKQYPPDTVYPHEITDECPEAREEIDQFLRELSAEGPSPEGRDIKSLGKKKAGLWQANLKVARRQIRILYAQYGHDIVLFRIHNKGSPQEQQRAYDLAVKRKNEHDALLKKKANHDGNRTVH
jgi:hypothetical protein